MEEQVEGTREMRVPEDQKSEVLSLWKALQDPQKILGNRQGLAPRPRFEELP